MKRVGIYLNEPVFSHGQLYVALSRVSRPENVTLFMDKKTKLHSYGNERRRFTKNIVFEEAVRDEKELYMKSENYADANEFNDGIFLNP